MTLIPAESNFLSPTGFLLIVDMLKGMTFFSQRVTLPGMSLGSPEEGTSAKYIPWTGETLTFDSMSVDFKINEDMSNFKAIHHWMTGIAFPEGHAQFRNFIARLNENAGDVTNIIKTRRLTSQGTLLITDATNNPNNEIDIIDMFPIYLGPSIFESNVSDIQYMTANVTFKIDRYVFRDAP